MSVTRAKKLGSGPTLRDRNGLFSPVNHEPASAGFTITELLVVIVIVAILASIVFSVLGSAKEKSFETVDIAQMKQVYTAVVLYEEQNDGIAPVQLDQLGSLVSDKAIFRSPVDPVKTPRNGVDYPVRLFYSEDERVPYRISYAYLRSYPAYDTDLAQWQRARGVSQFGMLACPWHGKPESPWLDAAGPACDGPVLRINMDGSFFRLARRSHPHDFSIPDMFFIRK